MHNELVERAVAMSQFHSELGLKRTDLQYCHLLEDSANPQVYSSNHVRSITASSADELSTMIRQIDAASEHLPYRHFVLDPLTPRPVAAFLLLNEYSEYAVTLQMILASELKHHSSQPNATLHPVSSDTDWSALRDLVLADHAEGARTKNALDSSVTDGIVASYRAKSEHCQFFLAELDGTICAYGSGTSAPDSMGLGMGMVEDLFTLPSYRGRGLASLIIDRCVEFCRSRGAGDILIGSHADQPPKHLYNRLGFEPAFVTRDLIKHLT